MPKDFFVRFYKVKSSKINYEIDILSKLETKMKLLCYSYLNASLYEKFEDLYNKNKYTTIY